MTLIRLAILIWALSAGSAIAAPQGFVLLETPSPVIKVRYMTGDGQRGDLGDFRGKVVLLNIWATWCVPCREEMPTLDALQAQLGSERFEVVALSIDSAGASAVRRFYDQTKVRNLRLYVDQTMLSMTALRAKVLPTTLLIDARGREIGRLSGAADWNDPKMVAFLRSFVD